MKYTVKHVDLFSAVKVSALVHCILLFLVGVIYGGVILIMSIISFSSGGISLRSGGVSLAISILSLIGLPIGGLIWGAVIGAVGSLLYNLVANFVGPITITLAEQPSKPVDSTKK